MLLTNQCHLFDLPEEIVYLNCASQSPQLKSVTALGQEAIARKARPWTMPTAERFEQAEKARSLFARLIGAGTVDNPEVDGVALIPSASYGISLAAANLPVKAGQKIVMIEEEFPSDVYCWWEVARHSQAELVTVARPVDADWTSALLEQLDQRTAVVIAPNCHWTDGSFIDLVQIGAKARAVGAALVVDATQSLGAFPFEVGAVQPDFVVAASYKWLLGPYSLAFLYVAPRWREGRPLEYNWLSREGSEDYTTITRYTRQYQKGARRYDVGERSDYVLVPMAALALEQLLSWGPANISQSLGELTRLVEEKAGEVGLRTIPSQRRIPHIIGLRMGQGQNLARDLVGRLAEQQIVVSQRGEVLRVSPHLYNSPRDISRLFEALKVLL